MQEIRETRTWKSNFFILTLFDRMLYFEKLNAGDLAFDRLTPKMIKFMAKNYVLQNYIVQNNGFSVYYSFFEAKKNKKKNIGDYAENILCIIFYLDNPHLNKNFLHNEDNQRFQKTYKNSPLYTGGAYYRDKVRNTNIEFNNFPPSELNQNNPYPQNHLSEKFKSFPPYGTNLNPNPQPKFQSDFRQNPSSYSNFMNGYNHDLTLISKYDTSGRNQSNSLVKQTPVNKVFGSIYFQDSTKTQGDDHEYYSKKKIQLCKDFYNSVGKLDEAEYKKQELEKRSIHQGSTNMRLDDIQRSISPSTTKFYEYNKRLDHKTVFDDKKILYNKSQFGNYYPYDKVNPTIVNY